MKNVRRETVVFDEFEVDLLWGAFLGSVEEFARDHYVRSGQMTREEANKKVSCEDVYLCFLDDSGSIAVSGIEVNVEIDMNTGNKNE